MRKISFRNFKPNTCATKFTQPSLTVPGQTLSLRELLERYVMGGQIEQFKGVYDGDSDLPDNLEQMDTFEKLDLARNLRESINNAQFEQPTSPTPTLTPPPPETPKTE
ncbi:hypothetical protein [Microviridae sp.]|nr:hypothetical protein [Microviridae sp.]